jgi:hypothetical protein
MVLMTFSLLKVSTSGLFEVVDGLLETFRKFSLVKLVTPAKITVILNLRKEIFLIVKFLSVL